MRTRNKNIGKWTWILHNCHGPSRGRGGRASLAAKLVKNPPAMRETWIQSLGWEDPLEKGKTTHSSILAWRRPWTLWSMGSQCIRHDWATFTSLHFRTTVGIAWLWQSKKHEEIPLSVWLSRQEDWSGWPFPSPGDLPDPGIEPASPESPILQVDSVLLNHQRSFFYIK